MTRVHFPTDIQSTGASSAYRPAPTSIFSVGDESEISLDELWRGSNDNNIPYRANRFLSFIVFQINRVRKYVFIYQ